MASGTPKISPRQPGGDAHGKIDTEQLAPELGHFTINLFAGDDIDRFHNKQQKLESSTNRSFIGILHKVALLRRRR